MCRARGGTGRVSIKDFQVRFDNIVVFIIKTGRQYFCVVEIDVIKSAGAKINLTYIFMYFQSFHYIYKDVIPYFLVYCYRIDFVVHSFLTNDNGRHIPVSVWLILPQLVKTENNVISLNVKFGGPKRTGEGSHGDREG